MLTFVGAVAVAVTATIFAWIGRFIYRSHRQWRASGWEVVVVSRHSSSGGQSLYCVRDIDMKFHVRFDCTGPLGISSHKNAKMCSRRLSMLYGEYIKVYVHKPNYEKLVRCWGPWGVTWHNYPWLARLALRITGHVYWMCGILNEHAPKVVLDDFIPFEKIQNLKRQSQSRGMECRTNNYPRLAHELDTLTRTKESRIVGFRTTKYTIHLLRAPAESTFPVPMIGHECHMLIARWLEQNGYSFWRIESSDDPLCAGVVRGLNEAT